MSTLFKAINRPNNKTNDSDIAKKVKSKTASTTTVKCSSGNVMDRISMAKTVVEQNLGQYRDEYIVIQDECTLSNYIQCAVDNGIISIDTETTGLDPLQDELVGISIYTPNNKPAYIPVNHKSYITGIKCDKQLDADVIGKYFANLNNKKTDIIMFNGCFDMRVLRHGIGIDLTCAWDTYLAARLLNENEENNSLKYLHQKYCTSGDMQAKRFNDLFSGISFDIIPINIAYLYAAHDAIITYELYAFQKPFLTKTDSVCIEYELTDVADVFYNIEMPCVKVVADMEDTGVDFDFKYNDVLKDIYHKKLDEQKMAVYRIIDMYGDEVKSYRETHRASKLDNPINIGSPTQLQILLYDIMKIPLAIDKKTKMETRSTSEDILKQLNSPICDEILKYRSLSVLVSTFIDKLPECVNSNDGRIHCKFNQYGADTGRFSSSDPNLQNIPSHNKDIRKMFKATDGYVLMSSDFSQQEPKCLAALCRKQGDSQMYDTFMQGKDLYSEIASKAFNVPYEQCCEFAPDGSKNPKSFVERRTQAKSILLGINYGRGVDSIAEQLGTTKDKAQAIKDSVFKGFPAIKQFEDDSIRMSKEIGFVTTVCGRKRRLPSMMLPDYEVIWKDGVSPDNDPLSFDDATQSSEVPKELQDKWIRKVYNAGFKNKRKVFEAANEEGLWILDHTRDKDTTKVVNARIQGSAADLTKIAMIELYNNERLRKLGFRMLIPVHDEIIAECPEENAKECAELLAKTMSLAAEKILEMPIKCDVEITKCWYGDSIEI